MPVPGSRLKVRRKLHMKQLTLIYHILLTLFFLLLQNYNNLKLITSYPGFILYFWELFACFEYIIN